MVSTFSRRTTLGVLGGFAASRFCGSASAQVTEPAWVIDLSTRLQDLRRSAGDAGLAATRNTRDGFAQLTQENAYLEGMPRLVDLIDRSENIRIDISDQAGQLLGELHARERFDKAEFPVRPGTRAPKPRLDALRGEYLRRFAQCKPRPQFDAVVRWHVRIIGDHKARYEKLSQRVSVPWYFIAIIHGLEASFNFRGHLHNGDAPLTQRTRNVPSNRPIDWLPPSDWESSAIDALTLEGFTGKLDWDLASMLYRWESYNGFGYRSRAIPTPYLWSFSNHYSQGKFVSDGKFDPTAKSKQCGAAVMLRGLVDAKLVKL
jgi:lysozyme family protein